MSIQEEKTIIAIYCRKPTEGRVKTRLASSIGEAKAVEFYHQSLVCLKHDLEGLSEAMPYAICPSGAREQAWAEEFFPNAHEIIPQIDGGLDQKLEASDRELRRRGYESIVFIGSDAPSLPVSYLSQCARDLQKYSAVLGPCRDGGVYAIGSRKPLKELSCIHWSTDHVCRELRDLLSKDGAQIRMQEEWYDVDVLGDLIDAEKDLALSNSKPQQDLAQWIHVHTGCGK